MSYNVFVFDCFGLCVCHKVSGSSDVQNRNVHWNSHINAP